MAVSLQKRSQVGDVVTTRAFNGHTMDYLVIGHYPDGRSRLQQWNAQHSESCDCWRWEGADRSLPDW